MKIKIYWLNRYTKTILRDVGLLLHVPGVMALLSLPVCLIFGEYYAIWPFVFTAIISFSLGQLLYQVFRQAEAAEIQHAMLIVALSWGVIPLLGTIPFVAIASYLAAFPETSQTIREFQHPLNAIFEAVSGYTSTGLTMALDASQLPHTLQWWRSFTEWIGGVGIIVLMLSVLEPNADPDQLYQAAGRQKKIAPTIAGTARKIWKIYLLYTVFSVLVLGLLGMPWWEAVNHAMTGISTGGFSITSDSLTVYTPILKLAAIAIMIAGAISFSVHAQFLSQRRLSPLWRNPSHRALWLLLVLGTILLLLTHYSFTGSLSWLDSLFQWVSALTTCGFNTVKIQDWSPSARLLMSLGMIFGAASGSTCGGLKLSRIVTLYKAVVWHLQQIFLKSDQHIKYKLDGQELTEIEAHRQIRTATVLTTLWLGFLGVGVFVLLHVVQPQYTVPDVILEAASAMGTSGLSVGITNPDLHWIGKLILILFMWMGRVEIIPVLVLFASFLRPVRQVVKIKTGQ
ncbi:TrkH family potassium uptake protein [Nostoc sp. UHCC 0252]|uniref:TrkH family potassium uptake protein n=1 Tax=Nostoc sp. UHCC 0252 TaxID=3110241 RepID=UPI002B1FE528|nr:TrkH family potassium uptake protein [Nostoc sp. UHCC 0252]MEA5603133.1 TrkH family potassium uptake protein [Nostoc sp. UHCC 0252]